MSDRFFLDTNLLLYTFDATAPHKARKAAQLVRRALDGGGGIISFQVVQEFFNVVLRRSPRLMNVSEAEQYLTTVLRPLLAVHSSPTLYFEALQIMGRHRLAWYDSLIVAAAIEGGCDRLLSEDFQHGQKIESLRIENPFAE
jgi:predicted nucleic acid-binding protein